MHMDAFWSYFAMPIGVTICFGPAVVVGLLTRRKERETAEKSDSKH